MKEQLANALAIYKLESERIKLCLTTIREISQLISENPSQNPNSSARMISIIEGKITEFTIKMEKLCKK